MDLGADTGLSMITTFGLRLLESVGTQLLVMAFHFRGMSVRTILERLTN